MATNITTDNLKTADTLEALGAGTESGSFLICGKGSKLYQLPFERLRKNVNDGVIIPVKTEDKAIYNELFIASEIVSIEEKLFNDFSINVDFSKDGNIVVMNNTAYLLNTSGIPYKVDLTNNTVERLSDNSFMAVIACRDYALFIHKYGFVSSTFGVNVYTGEIIHAADIVNTSLESMITSATLTRVQNNNYPFDSFNGVMMFDNESSYTYFYFTCTADGWTFKTQSQDYTDIEAETGEKQKDVLAMACFSEEEGNGLFFASCNAGIYCFIDESQTEFGQVEELKNARLLFTTEGICGCILTNKNFIFRNYGRDETDVFDLYSDEIVNASILQTFVFDNETIYALQPTTNMQKFAIVKYSKEEISLVKLITTDIYNVQNFVLDPIGMKNYLDGTIYEPSIMLVGVCDNYGSLGVSHSETTYKQILKIKLADGVKALTD